MCVYLYVCVYVCMCVCMCVYVYMCVCVYVCMCVYMYIYIYIYINIQGVNTDDIISVGETAIVCLYNGNPHHGINVLRYEKFCVKAATSTVPVQPGPLPPTSGSVKYHSLIVYHQIQEWLGVEMSYVDWGWKLSAGNLLPIMTDLQPAPQKFLEVVRCVCKSACDTMC